MVARPPADAIARRSAWSNVAPRYAVTFANYTALAIEPLLTEAQIGAGNRVLDLACGPGALAAAALQRGARVIAADSSRGMAAIARTAVPGADVLQADAQSLPLRDGGCDAVVANFGVHTFADTTLALGEMARALRRGGRMAFTVWDAAERSEAQRLLERAVRLRGDHPPEDAGSGPWADPGRTRELLTAAGFTEIRTRALNLVLHAASAEEIFEVFRIGTLRLAAMLSSHSAAALAAIRAEFTDSLIPWTDASGVAVPMRAILYAARRP
jgi:SAM-dependent methyltransferase